nr:C4-dicarboxylate ABC transporter [Escherichia coli]MDC6962043.1 C4-dicarboxylate ABC transporter [Escherichia coli]
KACVLPENPASYRVVRTKSYLFNKAVNYLTNTSVWIGGEAFFSTLSPEQLEMIHQTGYEAGVYSQKLTLERDAEMLKTMQAAGVEVIYPDTGPFQKKASEVYSQFPEWTPGLYETIQQQLQ